MTKTELAALRRSIRLAMRGCVSRLLEGHPDDALWEDHAIAPHEWSGPVMMRELKAAMAAFDRWIESIAKIQEEMMNSERTSMAALTTPAATPEECECYASGVVLGVMTSASPLVVASLLVALREAWAGHHPEITRVKGELAERLEKLEEIKRLRRQLMLGRDLSRELLHHAEPDGWYAAELRSKFRAWLELTDEQR